MAWYGIKSLFRLRAIGSPVRMDEDYDREATLVEERIVIVEANSIEEAERMGSEEALDYAAEKYENYYGQEVQTKLIGECECYEIDDSIESLAEVFSATEIVTSAVRDQELVDWKYGRSYGQSEGSARKKFFNAEFVRDARRRGIIKPPDDDGK